MRKAIPTILLPAILLFTLSFSCGGNDRAVEDTTDQDSGAIGAVEAINGIATPPVPTGLINNARDAAAAANAHVEAVDSILGSQ